jgi:hypothetical protein
MDRAYPESERRSCYSGASSDPFCGVAGGQTSGTPSQSVPEPSGLARGLNADSQVGIDVRHCRPQDERLRTVEDLCQQAGNRSALKDGVVGDTDKLVPGQIGSAL